MTLNLSFLPTSFCGNFGEKESFIAVNQLGAVLLSDQVPLSFPIPVIFRLSLYLKKLISSREITYESRKTRFGLLKKSKGPHSLPIFGYPIFCSQLHVNLFCVFFAGT